MKKLAIPYVQHDETHIDIANISKKLDELERHAVEYVPWPDYPYKPLVRFSVLHNNNCFFIKYFVLEKNIKATNFTNNSPVYKDACVEFFISFDTAGYYNFEFNCIGTCLAEFGKNKANRINLSDISINKIRSQSLINKNRNDKNIDWELTLAVPLSVFKYHDFTSFKSVNATGNFFKCGDELPEPHFLAWSDIKSVNPDFHQPDFFGMISFL